MRLQIRRLIVHLYGEGGKGVMYHHTPPVISLIFITPTAPPFNLHLPLPLAVQQSYHLNTSQIFGFLVYTFWEGKFRILNMKMNVSANIDNYD